VATAGSSALLLLSCGRGEIQKAGKDNLARACGFENFDGLNQTQRLIFNGAKENDFMGLCDALKTGMISIVTPDGGIEVVELSPTDAGTAGAGPGKDIFRLADFANNLRPGAKVDITFDLTEEMKAAGLTANDYQSALFGVLDSRGRCPFKIEVKPNGVVEVMPWPAAFVEQGSSERNGKKTSSWLLAALIEKAGNAFVVLKKIFVEEVVPPIRDGGKPPPDGRDPTWQ
jgi:hypothetical protein